MKWNRAAAGAFKLFSWKKTKASPPPKTTTIIVNVSFTRRNPKIFVKRVLLPEPPSPPISKSEAAYQMAAKASIMMSIGEAVLKAVGVCHAAYRQGFRSTAKVIAKKFEPDGEEANKEEILESLGQLKKFTKQSFLHLFDRLDRLEGRNKKTGGDCLKGGSTEEKIEDSVKIEEKIEEEAEHEPEQEDGEDE